MRGASKSIEKERLLDKALRLMIREEEERLTRLGGQSRENGYQHEALSGGKNRSRINARLLDEALSVGKKGKQRALEFDGREMEEGSPR